MTRPPPRPVPRPLRPACRFGASGTGERPGSTAGVTVVGILVGVDVVGRCEAPGCERSTRLRLAVRSAGSPGAGAAITGLACPRHATQTELGALLHGWSVERRA